MDNVPIAYTKILVPRRRDDVLSRPRLATLFSDLFECQLIILSAPAGYGKTTLLIDLAVQLEIPFCWLALDVMDRSTQRFVTAFLTALRQQFPQFGHQSLAALQNMEGTIEWERLMPVIVNDLYEHIPEQFVFVLDDYHLVEENEAISHFISLFVQQVDENCHLVLSSRTLPALPDLPLMIGRSQVGGLDFSALAFQPEEIQSLLQQNYNLTLHEGETQALAQETDGWITALLLSAQTMVQGMIDRVRVARVSGVGLYDYLATQVLEQQTPPLRAFLLRTALLGSFNADLCHLVFDEVGYLPDTKWQGLINSVLQRNLFVQSLGEDDDWIQYHHLFQAFLQEKMVQEHPEETQQIWHRLAAIYIQQQEWERAYPIYEQLNDLESITALIEQAGLSMLQTARQATLVSWIDALPTEVTQDRPTLLSLQGSATVDLGDAQTGLGLLDQAIILSRNNNDLLCLTQSLARRAGAYRLLNRHQNSLNDAVEALARIGEEPAFTPIRATALRAKGIAQKRLGHLSQSIVSFSEAREIHHTLGNADMVAMLDDNLGLAYHEAGNYQQARQTYGQALTHWQVIGNVTHEANVCNNLGVLHHFLGNYEQAEELLERALVLAQQAMYTRLEAIVLAGLGDIYLELDAPKAALDAYQRSRKIIEQISSPFLSYYVDVAEAAVARCLGQWQQAHDRLQTLIEGLSERSPYENGLYHLEMGRLSLDQNNYEQAVLNLQKAVNFFTDGELRAEAGSSNLFLAAAYDRMKKRDEAIAVLQAAFEQLGDMAGQRYCVLGGLAARNLLTANQKHKGIGKSAQQLLRLVTQFEENLPQLRRRVRQQAVAVPFAPPQIVIHTFGAGRVVLGGDLLTRSDWQSPMAPELLFFLLTRPQGLTKEEIGEFLWPDSLMTNLNVNFQKTIYRLRRALSQDIILFSNDDKRYRFNHHLDYKYDVAAFQTQLAQAEQAHDLHAQITYYQAALDLYKAPYLIDIGRTWVVSYREALSSDYRKALVAIATCYLQTENPDGALHYGQRLLQEDPLFEEAHRLVMRAYALQGNLVDVVRQFTQCQQLLRDELDVDPSTQTISLYQELTTSTTDSV